ncbi:MAG: hypothetical protein GW760_01445 [Legionella sp.]|jgi:hypothetical protein|nr:hypothetical protein [Legionella sp.]
MSVLPVTSTVTGALGFFAGAAGGASLATTIGVCCLGGAMLWPLGLALQLGVGFAVGDTSMIFPVECVSSIPAAAAGAFVCSMPVIQFVVMASIGAALLYLLGQMIYIKTNEDLDVNREEDRNAWGLTLSVIGYQTNF